MSLKTILSHLTTLPLYGEQERRWRLWPMEWAMAVYLVVTLIIMAFMGSRLEQPQQMLETRFMVVTVLGIIWFISNLLPCLPTKFVRVVMPFVMLSWLYPDTYEFCRCFNNLDHVFAHLDQQLFGCQPALLFSQHFPSFWLSEALNMGYASYFFMILVSVVCIWYTHPNQLQYTCFIILASFFTFYMIYIFLPVSGPQFYYQAEGVDPTRGGFPALGHYFNTHTTMYPRPNTDGFFAWIVGVVHDAGERPTAAFPSSHIGVATIMMLLVLRNRLWNVFSSLLPFYALLCAATVYIHAHYLVDAIAGFFAAFVVYFFLNWIYKKVFGIEVNNANEPNLANKVNKANWANKANWTNESNKCNSLNKSLLLFVLLFVSLGATSQEHVDCIIPAQREGLWEDSTFVQPIDTTTKKGFWDRKFWHKGIVGKVYKYLNQANTEKPLDTFDLSFIPGPFYNKTSGIGIGLVGSALYHMQPENSALQRSSLSLTGKTTVKGMFSVTLKGMNYFPDDRFRSDFKLEVSTFKTKFWGMGYDQCDIDENESFYRRNQLKLDGTFLFRLAKNTYLGPYIYCSLYDAHQPDSIAEVLLTNQPHRTSAFGGGLEFRFDNRDFALNAKKGVFIDIKQRATGAGHGAYSTTELRMCGYTPTWKGCILAGEIHSLINCGNGLPWTELATAGSNDRMRGYYEERYRDRNIIEAQVELRQHIIGRHGIAIFAGFANVFYDTHSWCLRKTLPNYGIGYRWRFKPGINVRLDFGMTRNNPGFIFSINEAF